MMANTFLIFALLATGIAAIYYVICHRNAVRGCIHSEAAQKAQLFYQAASAIIGVSGVYLLVLLLTDQFQYTYVYSYSARALPIAYKVSAFWAGQEGSVFLWLIFHTCFGLALSNHKATRPSCMFSYCVLQALLLAILIAQSPFKMLSGAAADGAGLNLMLQDPWMVIHPPLILLGYAGLAVPLVIALGGILDDNHKNWPAQALSWTLISWAILGAGIFIGGFWAYKVLGWGGYWAWDPVENSSLVPWLLAAALSHFLLIGVARPAGVKGSYVLAAFTYVMVLYGTFLTRSGLLSDFSVHSFADEGLGGLMAAFLPCVTVGAFLPLIIRWPYLPEGSVYTTINSRHFLLALATVALFLFAILVVLGMSTPLITSLFGAPYSVSADFYNNTALPIVTVLLLLTTLVPLVSKAKENTKLMHYWWLLLPGIAAAVWAGQLASVSLLIPFSVGLAAMGIVSNFVMTVRCRVSQPAGLSHIGFAVITLGILVSSAGSQAQTVTLVPEERHRVFGKEIVYWGLELRPEEHVLRHNFQIIGAGGDLLPSIMKLDKAGRVSVREPAIFRNWDADLYIAPQTGSARQGPITVEISQKPYINLVWIGAALLTIGTGWAGLRRLK